MKKVYIIAEAGVNHNGSLELAKRMVDAAREAGADAVKFQTFKADRLVSAKTEKAEYQKKATGSSESQQEMIRRFELDRAAHFELLQYCRSRGIEFLSTAFDDESVELLRELDLPIWKIPSGEITNLPYLRKLGGLGKPLILSTGMASLGEVEAALEVFELAGTPRARITVLHCTTEYPAPFAEVNLKAMVTMGRVFGVEYGYSDHTSGIAVPLAAAALGAVLIEKHFTLDKTMEGPDQKASLEPDELSDMVAGIRAVELALGDGVKRRTASELGNRNVARKSIVAVRRIGSGEVFSDENLTAMRPGTGISPMEWDRVVGRVALREFAADEEIEL